MVKCTPLAFVWAYKTRIYRDKEVKPIKIKKHGRPEKSLFTYGLEWLTQVLINLITCATKSLHPFCHVLSLIVIKLYS